MPTTWSLSVRQARYGVSTGGLRGSQTRMLSNWQLGLWFEQGLGDL